MAPEVRGTSLRVVAAAITCLAAVACSAIGFLRVASAAELQPWTAGTYAPFSLPDVKGTPIALGSYRGHVVLVHFFATWCEPCLTELPALGRLAARGAGKIKVLAISVAEDDSRVRRFLQTTPVDFPVALDGDRAVAKAWGVFTLPTTIVLDARSDPRLMAPADFDWDSIDPGELAATIARAPVDGTNAPTTSNYTEKLPHRGG
ncbi:MAG TPA: TlpA disulfide reductase family protein [Pseudolabrys sp.]|nr:TlpA disulfide reductase family protein [Pseudolabrys sp.]